MSADQEPSEAEAVGMFDTVQKLKSNSDLSQLTLAGRHVGETDAISIAEALESNTKLLDLNLAGCGIGIAAGAKIGQMLKHNTVLQTLNLARNACSNEITDFSTDLRPCPAAESFKMERLDRYSPANLMKRFTTNGGITSRDLGATPIAHQPCAACDGVLDEHGSNLAQIRQRHKPVLGLKWEAVGQLRPTQGQEIENEALAAQFQEQHLEFTKEEWNSFKVDAIQISYESFVKSGDTYYKPADKGGDGPTMIAEGLSKNKSLTHLNLSCNGIGAGGGIALARALCQNSTLAELHLGGEHFPAAPFPGKFKMGNTIGSRGSTFMAQALSINRTLVRLNLSGNCVAAEGGVQLGEALTRNNVLTELSLAHNSIGDEGAFSLAEALKLPTNALAMLDIGHNQIGARGAKALAGALRHQRGHSRSASFCATVRHRHNAFSSKPRPAEGQDSPCAEEKAAGGSLHLCLAGNVISSDGAMALAGAIKESTRLTALNLDHNDIGHAGITALADAVGISSSLHELHLSGNHMGPEAAVRLARAVRRRKKRSDLSGLMLNLGALSHEDKECSDSIAAHETYSRHLKLRSTKMPPADYSAFGGYVASVRRC